MLFIQKHKYLLAMICIFGLFAFLRLYQFELRNTFGWDQVDNAWAAKNIIVDHKFPLVGMVAKGNSGFFIGPLYYYAISFFYLLFRLDPIASGIFAAVSAAISFFVLFFVTKKLFSIGVAYMAAIIQTVAFAAIIFDRVQWPVDFIPAISLGIFYSLYLVMMGEEKAIFLVAILTGLAFHIHFTAVFFPLLILSCLPFFPKTRKMLFYGIVAIPLLVVWLVPNILYELQSKHTQTKNLSLYMQSESHGFHFVRFFQLAQDAFIQMNHILFFPILLPLKFMLLPLFSLVYYFHASHKKWFVMSYVMAMWFLIPWIVFTLYKGEISDYYFSSTRFIVVIIVSYLLYRIFMIKGIFSKIFIIIIIAVYGYINISKFFESSPHNLSESRESVKNTITQAKTIPFVEGDPTSYLYYLKLKK